MGFDKVLFDFLREGVLIVCYVFVKVLLKMIVYVFCNLSMFFRDVKVLIEGGYEMEKVGVVEMFFFIYYMEMMVLFMWK